MKIVLAVILALSAVPSRAAADDKALYDAAKLEKTVVWAAVPLEYNRGVAAAFEKKYPGVKVSLVTAGGTQLIQKFSMDKAAGKEETDCLSSGLTEAYPDMRRKGWLAPLDGLPEWSARSSADRDANGAYFYYADFLIVLMWNTQAVKAGEEPKTVRELADPKWKGRVVMYDPASAGVAVPVYRWAVTKLGLGLDWLKALRANDVMLAANAGQMDEAVASGRRAVALTRRVEAMAAKRHKAPVDFRAPEDGAMLHRMPLAVNAKAPHPNAARLFANWLLTAPIHRDPSLPRASEHAKDGTASGPWWLDPETVAPADTKTFMDAVLEALKG